MNTLDNYITEYLEYCEYRKRLDSKSLKAYRIDLKQYDTFSCNLQEGLSRNTLDSFITTLHKQYKPKTAKRKIASLKAFFIIWNIKIYWKKTHLTSWMYIFEKQNFSLKPFRSTLSKNFYRCFMSKEAMQTLSTSFAAVSEI